MQIIFSFRVLFFRSLEGDIPDFRSVDEWLKYINMAKYSETFKAANINTLDRVTKMEENDLKAIGIKLIGHRNKMSKSIKAMKLQFHNKALDDDEAAIWFVHSPGENYNYKENYKVCLGYLCCYEYFFIIRIVFNFLSSILSRTFFRFAVIISINTQTIFFYWKLET